MLKLIVYLVLGFYSTYMEVVQLVSKIRKFKIITLSNQLHTKPNKPLQKFQLLKGLLTRLANYIESIYVLQQT